MTEPFTPEQHLAARAQAFLLWRRSEADWSPPPFTEPARQPRAGTNAWRKDMYRRHAAKRRTEMLARKAKLRSAGLR
jgi:hypothetical protein